MRPIKITLNTYRELIIICISVLSLLFIYTNIHPQITSLNDVKVQYKIGETIYNSQTYYIKDTFSWTLEGATYYEQEWLHYLVFYLTSNAIDKYVFGSIEYQIIGFTVLFLFIALLGMYLLLRQIGFKPIGIFVSLIAFLIFLYPYMFVVSHLWSAALFPYLLFLITRFRKIDTIVLFILAFICMHASKQFFVLPIVIFLYLIGALIESDYSQVKKLVFILLGIVFLSFLHPLGFETIYFPFLEAFSDSFSLRHVTGWASPNFQSNSLLALGIAISFLLIKGFRNKFGFRYLLPFFFSALLVFFTNDMHSLFIIMLALMLGNVCNNTIQNYVRLSIVWCIFMLLLLVSVFLSCAQQMSIMESQHELINSMQELSRELEGDKRIFNHVSLSSLLIASDTKVFIDSRVGLYNQDTPLVTLKGSIAKDYIEIMQLKPDWQKIIEFWGLDVAVLPNNSALVGMLVEIAGWKVYNHILFSDPSRVRPNQSSGVVILLRHNLT
jgi:hypothetical protein